MPGRYPFLPIPLELGASAEPPSEIDVFRDLLRPLYDWQSSRTRRGLNIMAREFGASVEAGQLYSETPRLTPIANGTALCHVATGEWEGALQRRGVVMGRGLPGGPRICVVSSVYADQARDESPVLWPLPQRDIGLIDPALDPSDRNPLAFAWRSARSANQREPMGPVSSTMRHLSYNETLTALGFLFYVLDERTNPDDANSPTFRNVLDDLAAGRPSTATVLNLPADVWRLHRFARALPSLRRQPGRILLRAYHPYELSNEFVGWNFMGELHPLADDGQDVAVQASEIPEAYLWPVPGFARTSAESPVGQEPTVGGWVVTRPISLYSGQHLVGEGDPSNSSHRVVNGSPGARAEPGRPLRWDPGYKDGGERRYACLTWLPTPDDDTPPLRLHPIPDAAVQDAAAGNGDGNRCVIRAAWQPGDPLVEDISVSDLGIHISCGATEVRLANRVGVSLPALDSVLNLDGADGARVERVRIGGSRRRTVNEVGEGTGDELATATAEHAPVRLGVSGPTVGCVFRDVWCGLVGRRASVHFGPRAVHNVWWGGEFVGNTLGLSNVPRDGVVHFSEGSETNIVMRGSAEVKVEGAPAHFLMEGIHGVVSSIRLEAHGFDVPLRQLPVENEIWIGPTGRGNVVDHQFVHEGKVRDEGAGSFVRAWRAATTLEPRPAPVRAATHENVLGDTLFVDVLSGSGRPTRSWNASGAVTGGTTRGHAVLTAERGRTASLAQTVSINDAPEPPTPIPEGDTRISRVSREQAIEWQGSVAASQRANDVSLVAAVRVVAAANARATLIVAGAASEGRYDLRPGADGFAGELRASVRAAASAGVTWSFVVDAGRVEIFDPLLVHGTVLPTYPVAPVGFDGARIYGPLWLPGPLQTVELQIGHAVVLGREAEVHAMTCWLGDHSLPDDLPIELHLTHRGTTRLLARGVHPAGVALGRVEVPDRPLVHEEDTVLVAIPQGVALAQAVRRRLRCQLHLNVALRERPIT